MNYRKCFALICLILLTLAVWPVQAQEGSSGVVFTDRYTLREGQRVEGDLVVVAQTIVLQSGSEVTGSVALLGEDITLNGRIVGDLAALARNIMLGSGTYVTGNVSLCGGSIRREQSTSIVGDYSASCDRVGSLLGEVAPLILDPSRWEEGSGFDPASLDPDLLQRIGVSLPLPEASPLERLGRNVMVSLVMGALAALYTLLIPLRLRRMSDAALSAPVTTGLIGLLSLVSAGAVTGLVLISLVLVVTGCLLPILLLSWIGLALMVLAGWAALGLPVGAWFLAQMNIRRVSPLAAAAVGAMLLTFLVGLLAISSITYPLFFLALLLLASWGLGAGVMTRLGGQTYPNPVRRWANAPRRVH